MAPDTYLPNQTILVGIGSEIVFLFEMLLMLISVVAGVFLCVNGFQLIFKEGVSTVNILPVFFGFAGITWPFFYMISFIVMSESNLSLVVSQIAWNIMFYVPGMLASFMLYSLVYAALRKPKKYDYIIVLGCGLKADGTVTPLLASRLNKAIKVFEASGRSAWFIVSGGKGTDEIVSEAHAMRKHLLSHGITDETIIMEDQSRNTYENIKFSKALMKARGEGDSCLIVTSNFHVLRAVILAKNLGLDSHGVGSKTKFYYLPAAFIREYIAIIFGYRALALSYIAIVICLVLFSAYILKI
jgi:uncharacterized SAM-binding protein YcdF (DUF218 family)